MTSIKITPTLALSNENLYLGKTYACIQCTRSQKWRSRRRFSK